MPFFSPTQHRSLTPREARELPEAASEDFFAVPQVLTKEPEDFLWAAQVCADRGYRQINLNLGCPSGTVVSKGKGSGMLADPARLDSFLDTVCARSPIPISVKTRLGLTDPEEFPRLLDIFNRYPLELLILHPRVRKDFYDRPLREDWFSYCLASSSNPVCRSGGICTRTQAIFRDIPVMIGRGLIANPALAQELNGGDALTPAALRDFHNRLFAAYCEKYPPHVALGRMREIAKHMVCCFEQPEKPHKAIRKASSLRAYSDAIDDLFSTHAFCAHPAFQPD